MATLTVRRFAGRSVQPELVQIVDARALPNAVELLHERGREDFAQRPCQRLPARQRIHHFHLRVPGLDAVGQIDRQHADVDRLDDILVEVLQPLVFGDFLFQRCVQPSILDGDTHVAGQRFQQLDVFAGQEIAFDCLAQSEHGDACFCCARQGM